MRSPGSIERDVKLLRAVLDPHTRPDGSRYLGLADEYRSFHAAAHEQRRRSDGVSVAGGDRSDPTFQTACPTTGADGQCRLTRAAWERRQLEVVDDAVEQALRAIERAAVALRRLSSMDDDALEGAEDPAAVVTKREVEQARAAQARRASRGEIV